MPLGELRMTNKDAILAHLVWIASDNAERPGDKKYAWEQAAFYAGLYSVWSDLPELLKKAMQEKAAV